MTVVDTDRRYRPRPARDVILFMLALYTAAHQPHPDQAMALDLLACGVATDDTARCWS